MRGGRSCACDTGQTERNIRTLLQSFATQNPAPSRKEPKESYILPTESCIFLCLLKFEKLADTNVADG